MKVVMNLTDLAVVAFALGGGVMGLVMLELWALADIGPQILKTDKSSCFCAAKVKG
jgi:hypothetical protein